MLSLFLHKKPIASPSAGPPLPIALPKGLTRPESAASLLATPRRQRLLEHIWQRTSVSRSQFASLYRAPFERYAELVQQLPASESHHHAYLGGMLDHGLEIVAYALKLRQSHLLPAGATPEAQAAQAEAWTAGTAYAALLHDIGKIAVDLHIEYGDGTLWHPWHGPLHQPYRFRYRGDREYRLHSAATGLLYRQLLDRHILDWLSGYPSLWGPLLYVMAGQYEHAGVLGELVVQADRASVAQELGGDPARAMAAPKHALQRKLLDGLRYLLKGELRLNQPEASDGWLTEDALWLVSKTVSDKLRAHLLSQGIDGIPASNTAVFNVLQEHNLLLAAPDDRAIWRATVKSETGWSNSFTFLKLAPALIWTADERPGPFAGTVSPDDEGVLLASTAAQSEVAQTSAPLPAAAAEFPRAFAPTPHGLETATDDVADLLNLLSNESEPPDQEAAALPFPAAQPSSQPPGDTSSVEERHAEGSGMHFMRWLQHGVRARRLIVNDAKAQVHTVAGTVYLVSPGLFQRYVQEHPVVAALAKADDMQDWRWVQREFERLRQHRKQPNGLNIWTCSVTGPRKTRRLHGYLLETGTDVFEAMPPNNPYLVLLES